MSFGTQLQAARRRARLTLRQVGEAADISIAYLHDIEHERRRVPSFGLCCALMRVVGVKGRAAKLMLDNAEHEIAADAIKRWHRPTPGDETP